MRSLLLLFILTIACLATIVSCRKGELPDEYYYGKVSVSLVGLPNTPDIEVRFGGKKFSSTILPGGAGSFEVLSQEGKLEIFKAHTDSLLADTLITIPPNTERGFRFAYSEAFGLQGFVAGGDVAADSVKIQFLNNLGDYYKAFPSIDLHIGYYDVNVGGFVESGVVIKDFSKVQLSAAVTLPIKSNDGSTIFYFARVKNASTGEFIVQPSLGSDWFFMTGFDQGGTTQVIRLFDTNGDISIEAIQI
jgi:hypothetical protein